LLLCLAEQQLARDGSFEQGKEHVFEASLNQACDTLHDTFLTGFRVIDREGADAPSGWCCRDRGPLGDW